MKVYRNLECGNIHFTKEEMITEAKEMYDYGDPTNCCQLVEYYECIEIGIE